MTDVKIKYFQLKAIMTANLSKFDEKNGCNRKNYRKFDSCQLEETDVKACYRQISVKRPRGKKFEVKLLKNVVEKVKISKNMTDVMYK